MNRFQSLLIRIKRWYLSLFIEVPDGYGNSTLPEVDKFQKELDAKGKVKFPVQEGIRHHELKK